MHPPPDASDISVSDVSRTDSRDDPGNYSMLIMKRRRWGGRRRRRRRVRQSVEDEQIKTGRKIRLDSNPAEWRTVAMTTAAESHVMRGAKGWGVSLLLWLSSTGRWQRRRGGEERIKMKV